MMGIGQGSAENQILDRECMKEYASDRQSRILVAETLVDELSHN